MLLQGGERKLLSILLCRIKLLRYVDVLEKAIDSNSEGQLREAISVARKAAPNDDSDDAENACLNLALGKVLDMLLLDHACPFQSFSQ